MRSTRYMRSTSYRRARASASARWSPGRSNTAPLIWSENCRVNIRPGWLLMYEASRSDCAESEYGWCASSVEMRVHVATRTASSSARLRGSWAASSGLERLTDLPITEGAWIPSRARPPGHREPPARLGISWPKRSPRRWCPMGRLLPEESVAHCARSERELGADSMSVQRLDQIPGSASIGSPRPPARRGWRVAARPRSVAGSGDRAHPGHLPPTARHSPASTLRLSLWWRTR